MLDLLLGKIRHSFNPYILTNKLTFTCVLEEIVYLWVWENR